MGQHEKSSPGGERIRDQGRGKGLQAAAPPFIVLQMFLVSLLIAAFPKPPSIARPFPEEICLLHQEKKQSLQEKVCPRPFTPPQ